MHRVGTTTLRALQGTRTEEERTQFCSSAPFRSGRVQQVACFILAPEKAFLWPSRSLRRC